jgi:hypothetical protein
MRLGIPERAIEKINPAVHAVFAFHLAIAPTRQLFLG